MVIQTIFGLQFVLSLILWSLIAKWLLAPWLKGKSAHEALFWLTIPHAFRYIGMVFLVPGVVSHEIPNTFATLAGYGDLATGVLAILALVALRYKWVGALATGMALQYRWHGRFIECVAACKCGSLLWRSLVYTDILRAAITGDAFHNFCAAGGHKTRKKCVTRS